MPTKRTTEYKKLRSLEDERRLDVLEAVSEIDINSRFDMTADIPGTIPEKIIYNYLLRLGISFNFQYHMPENYGTANPESDWVPDFILPDYNNTLIEVYGTYWHTMSREKDQLKKVYWLIAGYTIIERGIPLYPTGPSNGGAVVIWWEDEIYFNLDGIVQRDIPEILNNRIAGTPGQYLLDSVKEFEDMEKMRSRLAVAKVVPQLKPENPRIKKLRRKYYGKIPELSRIKKPRLKH